MNLSREKIAVGVGAVILLGAGILGARSCRQENTPAVDGATGLPLPTNTPGLVEGMPTQATGATLPPVAAVGVFDARLCGIVGEGEKPTVFNVVTRQIGEPATYPFDDDQVVVFIGNSSNVRFGPLSLTTKPFPIYERGDMACRVP